MVDGTHTRRSILRRSFAAASVGTLLASAGCSGLNPLGGGAGAYADWLPVPDDTGDSDHYQFTYLDTETLEANEDELPDSFDIASFEENWNPADVDWEDTASVLFFSSTIVVEDGFTREDVVADLEAEDYDEDGEYQGHTVLVGPNELGAFAVGDSTLVVQFAAYQSDPVDNVEAVLDVKNGEEDRYADDSENMATLLPELGNGTIVGGRTMAAVDTDNPDRGRFDHMVAEGSTTTIDGDTAERKWLVVYEESDDVDTDDLSDWVDANDSNGGTFDDVDDISYSQNGRVGIVTGTSDTDDL